MKKIDSEKTNGKANAEIELPDIKKDPVTIALEAEQAAAEKKCSRLEVVERELAELRGKIQSLESDRAKHVSILEGAIEERRQFAFHAAANGDLEAQERLKKARAAQAEAALALEDQESAIAEGRRQFDALELERDGLAPSGPWHDAMVLAKDLLAEDAEKIDFYISGLIEVLSPHQGRLEALKMFARDSGRERSFGNCGLRQVMRVFSTKMSALWPLEFEKFRQYDKKSYSDILRSQVAAGIGLNLDVESESGATEPTTAVEATEESAEA